jgi:hypothetical protein
MEVGVASTGGELLLQFSDVETVDVTAIFKSAPKALRGTGDFYIAFLSWIILLALLCACLGIQEHRKSQEPL